MYDVAIVGAGVIGALTARELTKYGLEVCLIEKHSQPGNETSKANSAIVHGGYDCPVGSNKARFNVPGNALMERVCEELGVEFSRCGSLVLAFDEDEEIALNEMLERGRINGVKELSVISGDEARNMEPNLSEAVRAALWCKSAGIISSYKLSRRAVRHAVENGLTLLTNAEVTHIEHDGGVFVIETAKAAVRAKYLINAAGVFADEVARMVGDDSFKITPRKGEYILYDKNIGDTVKSVIFQMPSKLGKGILVAPTTGGPLLIGPTAVDITDKRDVSTTEGGLADVLAGASKSVPMLTAGSIITSFTGLRAVADTNDFIIGPSHKMENLFHLAGMQSPGLSAAPAVAEYMAGIITGFFGAEMQKGFNPKLKEMPHAVHVTPGELNALIKKNPDYGVIICRCETVSKAEILDAISGGADDLDSIKQDTRAGMGRCQGGFCMPRVLEILARETGRPFTGITKNGDGSYILTEELKTGQGGRSYE